MPAAPDDKAQIVLAGEVDGSGDIRGALGGHGKGAWLQRPGIDPSGRLRQPDLVADVVGILKLAEQGAAGLANGGLPAWLERRLHSDQPAADAVPQPVPFSRRRPIRVARADPRRASARRHCGCRREAIEQGHHKRRRCQSRQ